MAQAQLESSCPFKLTDEFVSKLCFWFNTVFDINRNIFSCFYFAIILHPQCLEIMLTKLFYWSLSICEIFLHALKLSLHLLAELVVTHQLRTAGLEYPGKYIAFALGRVANLSFVVRPLIQTENLSGHAQHKQWPNSQKMVTCNIQLICQKLIASCPLE